MIARTLRRAKRADRFEEIASALDAGLGPDQALAAAGIDSTPHTGASIATTLDRSGVELDQIATAVLEAAEAAGELPGALRRLARLDRDAADHVRTIIARTIYPVVLTAMASGLMVLLLTLGFHPPTRTFGTVLTVFAALVLLATWLTRKILRDPAFDARDLPIIGGLVIDVAEAPYLDAMSALHGAGVRLREAHDVALRAVVIAAVRGRLAAATSSLTALGYHDALANADALVPETLTVLGNAERSGELESGFARIAERRRAGAQRKTATLVKVTGFAIYLTAVSLVVIVVLSFYSELYGPLRGFQRR